MSARRQVDGTSSYDGTDSVGLFRRRTIWSCAARITGVARMTVEKLLRDIGTACATMQDEKLRNLPCKRIQCDEIWSFIGAKEKNTSAEKKALGWGDCWTWVAIDADTKLVPSWRIGPRDASTAYDLMQDLAGRLTGRVQLTTDGFKG